MKNYISTIKLKLTNKLMKLASDSRGIGTIEMVLLIVVILGILVLFRDYILALISSIFSIIDNQIINF